MFTSPSINSNVMRALGVAESQYLVPYSVPTAFVVGRESLPGRVKHNQGGLKEINELCILVAEMYVIRS